MYFTAATVSPEYVSAEQTDNQTVHVSWSAIPSDQQPYVESDVTYYEVQYWSVGGTVQGPTNVQAVTSTSLTVSITYQHAMRWSWRHMSAVAAEEGARQLWHLT